MTKKATLTDLKKHLRQKTDRELVDEIAHLYKKFPQVKEHYQASFFQNDDEVLEKYKKIVRNEYIASGRQNFPKMRASVARKAVSDYAKVSCSPKNLADLMLTFVESGVDFTDTYGDIDEPFYNSMESMFERLLKFLVKEDLFDHFYNRLEKIVLDTRGMGWGFHDELSYLFETYQKKQHKNNNDMP